MTNLLKRSLLAISFVVAVLGCTSTVSGQGLIPKPTLFANVTIGSCVVALLFWCGTFAVAAAELKLFKNRNEWYLTKGVPLFKEERFCNQVGYDMPETESMFRKMQSKFFPPFRFQQLGPDAYSFAESRGSKAILKYGPIMRGLIYFDSSCSRVVIKGIMNWFPLAACLSWLVTLGFTPWGLTPLLFVFCFYVCQYIRYRQVLKVAADAWSETFAS